MIIDAYESFDRDLTRFWIYFTGPNDKRSNFTQIVKQLRREKIIRDQRDTLRARCIYSATEFERLFTYTKNGRSFLMRKPEVIARHFRKLQNRNPTGGLPSYDDIATTCENNADEDIDDADGSSDNDVDEDIEINGDS